MATRFDADYLRVDRSRGRDAKVGALSLIGLQRAEAAEVELAIPDRVVAVLGENLTRGEVPEDVADVVDEIPLP